MGILGLLGAARKMVQARRACSGAAVEHRLVDLVELAAQIDSPLTIEIDPIGVRLWGSGTARDGGPESGTFYSKPL